MKDRYSLSFMFGHFVTVGFCLWFANPIWFASQLPAAWLNNDTGLWMKLLGLAPIALLYMLCPLHKHWRNIAWALTALGAVLTVGLVALATQNIWLVDLGELGMFFIYASLTVQDNRANLALSSE